MPSARITGVHHDAIMPHPLAPRAFVITPYLPSTDGVLRPAFPDRCLDAEAGAGCTITFHHARSRVTGPRFPLTVVSCETHGHAFTLYPPGHVPYGREAVVPVSAGGAPVLVVPPESGGEQLPGKGELGWSTTFVAAALDAAAGIAWAREYHEADPRWWHTQGRRLDRAADVLGIVPGDERRRAEMAEQLGVPHLELRDGMRQWATASGYRSRGKAVMEVVELLGGPCLCDQVIAAGTVAGLWGPASRWDPDKRVLRRVGVQHFRPP